MISGLSPTEEKNLILSVGTHRASRPLSPVEVGRLLVEANQAGASVSDLAAACHLEGGTWIGRFMRLAHLAPSLHHLVDWGSSKGTLSMTQAQELARLPTHDSQETVGRRAIEERLNSHEVRQVVQLLQRSATSPDEAVDSVLSLRPQVVRQFVYLATITGEQVRQGLAELTQAERNQLLDEVLKQLGLRGVGARLGEDRFTLTANEETARGLDIDLIEGAVNSALSTRLAEA